MKKGAFLVVSLVLLAMLFALPVKAAPAWFGEAQMQITAFNYVGPVTGGIQFDVLFSGVADGPNIIAGSIEGVDHVVMDAYGIGHLNIYFTVTDKDGDKVSGHATGLSVPRNPGLIVFEDHHSTIINTDEYPTNGKFVSLIGAETRDEGFISALSTDPPGGIIHVKMYLN